MPRFRIHIFTTLAIIGTLNTLYCQELFINARPASTLPKGTYEIQLRSEFYEEGQRVRSMIGAYCGYGLLKNLTLQLGGSFSNHHPKQLAKNFLSHTHVFFNRAPQYPILLNGLNAYLQYRWLSIDKKKRHFRSALFLQGSSVRSAHDEAEPGLEDDTGGFGFGIIFTQLLNRLAISGTTCAILPSAYNGHVNGDKVKLNYGDALEWKLSFGYLLLPFEYKSYSQTNTNLYLEFIGRSYDSAQVFIKNIEQENQSLVFDSGSYVEMHIGLQKIYNSNTRINLSIGTNIINNSFIRTYPLIRFSYLHNIYRK